ncbi:uncharacterized protein [Cardiocondyla obscurior]|uniref:uncharacterized protein n=1 Tax=Cardiocondyla obscurior TaxID=286306 RepID=UPI003965874F
MQDDTGTVALTWRWWRGAPPCAPIGRGRRFAAVHWGPVAVVGTYLPPSGSIQDYEGWLEEIGVFIDGLQPLPVVLAGDFNAWSTTWGSRQTNRRGRTLEEWAATRNLVLLNQGNVPTCVRPQGESIIDLTWATPAAANMVRKWKVADDLEHLSDHRYILLELGVRATPSLTKKYFSSEKRWALKKLREDTFGASLEVSCWSRESQFQDSRPSIAKEVDWMEEAVTSACDVSMPRVRRTPRRSTYWWNDDIAELRQKANIQRRILTRCRRNSERRAAALEDYKTARMALRVAIRESKARSWEELISDLDEDPWGLAYKVVTKKLRPPAPSVTETLSPVFVKEVVDTLFPKACVRNRVGGLFSVQALETEDPEFPEIEEEEFSIAAKRSFSGNTAPGPDGLHKKVWALALQKSGRAFEIC